MRVLQVNCVYPEGSTGKIAKGLHDACVDRGMECVSAFRHGKKDSLPEDSLEISSRWDSRVHGVLARFTMFKGCFSYFKTHSFVRKLKVYKPDVIHLHNLHGSYVNVGLLMNYIKANDIPVVFTLHDCWAFTAICSHFTIAGCDKWETGCGNCPQRRKYSSSPIDLTAKMWGIKKKWFTEVERLVVVTPSEWLADLAKRSFLGEYSVMTINNGIDLAVFAPAPSDFRSRYALDGKKIVLGVAFGWSYEKGLDVFVDLARRLPDDYGIVLVGADEAMERSLPTRIVSIRRTNEQKELAEIYTAADVFVNPTREDVLPTVNIEALACGTPVVTFNAGGSPECIDATCGASVAVDDIDALEREIIRICEGKPFGSEACVHRAAHFDKDARLGDYLDLYESLVSLNCSSNFGGGRV